MMRRIDIGIDPDSEKHGVSIYVDGHLTALESMPSIKLFLYIQNKFKCELRAKKVFMHIENVCGNSSSAFNHRRDMSSLAKFKVSESVGMVKHAQRTVEEIASHFDIPVHNYNPCSMWKDAKTQKPHFERATKWSGRSNEDTRSAAWFGFQGVRKWKQ